MLIGEQPGDSEDLAGQPFVGPAGRLLDDVLDAAGIPLRAPDEELRREARAALFADIAIIGEYHQRL